MHVRRHRQHERVAAQIHLVLTALVGGEAVSVCLFERVVIALGNGDRRVAFGCFLRGHTDFCPDQRALNRDGPVAEQIDIVRVIKTRVVGDLHGTGHRERPAAHIHAAAIGGCCVAGDAAAAHGERAAFTHKHAAAGAGGIAVTGRCVAGDAAAAHIERASSDIHTATVRCIVAGNAAALHVERAVGHEHAVAVLSSTVGDGACFLAVGQRESAVDEEDARMVARELNAFAIEAKRDRLVDRDACIQRKVIFKIVVACGQHVGVIDSIIFPRFAAYLQRTIALGQLLVKDCAIFMAVRLRRRAKCRRRHALLGQDIPLALSGSSAIPVLPGSGAIPVLPGHSVLLILSGHRVLLALPGHSVPLALLCRESVSCAACPRLLCQRRRRQQRQAQHQRKENTQYFFLHRLVPPVFRVLGSPASRTEKPLPRIRGTTGHAPL